MITITYKDKTYTAIGLDDSLGKWIEELAQKGYIEEVLEEVKENKEIEKKDTALWMNETFVKPFLEKHDNQSILEKLREELDKLQKYIKDASQDRGTSDTNSIKGYLLCLSDVNNLLTSLEHPVSSSCSGDSSKTGDCYTESKTGDCYTEIKEENTCMTGGEWTEEQLKNSPMVGSMTKEEPEEHKGIKIARPQPQEDIELLDEFDHETCSDWKMGLQVELLTNAVNQLIKANKK